jgi:hypothetical protein
MDSADRAAAFRASHDGSADLADVDRSAERETADESKYAGADHSDSAATETDKRREVASPGGRGGHR